MNDEFEQIARDWLNQSYALSAEYGGRDVVSPEDVKSLADVIRKKVIAELRRLTDITPLATANMLNENADLKGVIARADELVEHLPPDGDNPRAWRGYVAAFEDYMIARSKLKET